MTRRGHYCLPLIQDISTPLVSPAFLKTHPVTTVADLAGVPLLHMKSRPDAWQRWFARHSTLDTDTIHGPALDHYFLTLQSAVSGLGAALGPLVMVEEDLAAGRLVTPFPDKTIRGAGFHVLVREAGATKRHQQAFLTALYQSMGRPVPRKAVTPNT
jgi:LysR family glycine cleavage system transcriptional activator